MIYTKLPEIRCMDDVKKHWIHLMKKGIKNWTKNDIKVWDYLMHLIQIDNFVKGKTKKGSHLGTKVKENIIEW